MSVKKIYTEENIQKLINSGFNEGNRPTTEQREAVLNMLLQKMPQPQKEIQPGPISIIGLSVLWIIFLVLLFVEFHDSIYMLDFIKAALGLSLLSIPVSSFILIIVKLRSHEKRMV